MKMTAIALGLAMTVAGSASFAGGIQIDPDGNGSIASSIFIIDPGSSRGNMLMQNVLSLEASVAAGLEGFATGDNADGLGADDAVGGGDDAFIYAHNSFDLTGSGCAGCELTFLLTIPVTSEKNLIGSQLTYTIRSGAGVPAPVFSLYFQGSSDASIVGNAIFANVGNTAEASGLGYGLGGGAVKVAEGSIALDPNQTFGFTNTSGLTAGPMSANQPGVLSINGTGSTVFLIDLDPTKTNTDYIVNEIDALTVDMSDSTALNLRYNQGPAPTPRIDASTAFADGAVTPDLGVDGQNDFGCGDVVFCDIQAQMNSTLTFNAPRVPEPASVLLLGAGLAMVGGASRRLRKNKA